MNKLVRVFKYAFAFIGVIIGAGFASGQEILQYFTSFGMMGTLAAGISGLLFAYLGYVILRLSSRLRAKNHQAAMNKISGPFLGKVLDWILILAIFGTGVVMVAGAGSNLNQQFGVPVAVGSIIMAVLVISAGLSNLDRFVSIISSLTPFLLLAIVIIAVYSIFTMEGTFSELNATALATATSLPNWVVSSLNYVTFNLAFGASMAIVMGGNEKDEKVAAWGGLVGGLGIGVLTILAHLAIFSRIETVASYDMPLLAIANEISPYVGFFMSLVLIAMIFSSAAAMFYSFSSRFAEVGTKKFKLLLITSTIIGLVLSSVGFTGLVSTFYPLLGYVSLVLVGVLIAASFRMNKFKPEEAVEEAPAKSQKVTAIHKKASNL